MYKIYALIYLNCERFKKTAKKVFFLTIQLSAFIMNIKQNIKTLIVKKPLKLDCGQTIDNFPLAYETYGSLNNEKDNAILVFHALTGDQFVTGINPVTKKDGWWSYAVGSGKSIDTDKYFVILSLIHI